MDQWTISPYGWPNGYPGHGWPNGTPTNRKKSSRRVGKDGTLTPIRPGFTRRKGKSRPKRRT